MSLNNTQSGDPRGHVGEEFIGEQVIPIIEEQLEIEKLKKVTGVVRLEKTVRTTDAVIDQELLQDAVSVTRVPVNRILSEPAVTRQEGDATIFPVMEEVLVVTKQLVLKEEVWVTKKTLASRHHESVPLRVEDIQVERLQPDPDKR